MPDLLDPAEPMQIRGLTVSDQRSPALAPMSETKQLYFRAKKSRSTLASEKRPYPSVWRHYGANEERNVFKILVKSMPCLVKVFYPGVGSGNEPGEKVPLGVRVSLSQLFRKLKSELSSTTFEELRQVIRAEGIAVMVARRSQDANRRDQSFICRAKELDARGHTDAALDLIYDAVDKLMRDGQFPKLDSILSGVPVSDFTVDILLGLLTAPLPVRNRLASRQPLFRQIQQTLKNRGQLEPGILAGLE